MSKRERKTYIECAHHEVQVSFVTEKYLRSIIKVSRKDNLLGGYVSKDNKIYLLKGMDDHKTKHTLLHELKHAFDDQVEAMDEEGKCDAFATMFMRICQTPWQELLKNAADD